TRPSSQPSPAQPHTLSLHDALPIWFLEKLRVLDDGRRHLVAPEGLSRFYLTESPTERRVGATWMTREDRLAEIDDSVRYLDAVYDDVFGRIDRARVTVHALGFSQGAATVSRWTALGKS